MRRILCLLGVGLAILPTALLAQKDETLQVFHGMKDKTFAYAWNADGRDEGRTRVLEGRRLKRLVSPNDTVCIEVPNAHKLFYEYSLDVRKDSTPYNPGIVGIDSLRAVLTRAAELAPEEQTDGKKAILNTTLQAVDPQATKASVQNFQPQVNAPRATAWWAKFAAMNIALQREIDSARNALNEADNPGTFSDAMSIASKFESARTFILTGLSSAPGHFNDAKLADAFAKTYADTKDALEKKPVEERSESDHLVLEFLKAQASNLVDLRNAMKASLEQADGYFRGCHQIGDTPETVQLRISSKVAGGKLLRSTGSDVIELAVVPRPTWMRIVPVLYSLPANLRQNYEIKNGRIVLHDDGSSIHFSPGAMLGGRVPLPAVEIEQNTVRVGLGVAISKNTLNSVFWGSYISFRDYFGVGLAYGDSRTESLKAGVQAGDALPDGKELKDLVNSQTKRGVFLLFSLRGISPTSPLGGLTKAFAGSK